MSSIKNKKKAFKKFIKREFGAKRTVSKSIVKSWKKNEDPELVFRLNK